LVFGDYNIIVGGNAIAENWVLNQAIYDIVNPNSNNRVTEGTGRVGWWNVDWPRGFVGQWEDAPYVTSFFSVEAIGMTGEDPATQLPPPPPPPPPAPPQPAPQPTPQPAPQVSPPITVFDGMPFFQTRDGEMLFAPLFEFVVNPANPEFVTSYVMVRVVADALGLSWDWNPATQSATFSDGINTVVFTHNSPVAMINGAPVQIMASNLPADARIINDRFFVPIAFFADPRVPFDVDVMWNGASRTVTVAPR
jgi:hypothetical protein